MRIDTYLVFNRRGSIRAVKNLPDLHNGEYAVRLRLTCPDSVFRPEVPIVEMTVQEREVIEPTIVVTEPPSAPVPTPDGAA